MKAMFAVHQIILFIEPNPSGGIPSHIYQYIPSVIFHCAFQIAYAILETVITVTTNTILCVCISVNLGGQSEKDKLTNVGVDRSRSFTLP